MAPVNHYYYRELDCLCEMAALYACHLALNHASMAGNKRTAMAASIAFLVGNGAECRITDQSYGELIESVIQRRADVAEVAAYLRQHTACSDAR